MRVCPQHEQMQQSLGLIELITCVMSSYPLPHRNSLQAPRNHTTTSQGRNRHVNNLVHSHEIVIFRIYMDSNKRRIGTFQKRCLSPSVPPQKRQGTGCSRTLFRRSPFQTPPTKILRSPRGSHHETFTSAKVRRNLVQTSIKDSRPVMLNIPTQARPRRA